MRHIYREALYSYNIVNYVRKETEIICCLAVFCLSPLSVLNECKTHLRKYAVSTVKPKCEAFQGTRQFDQFAKTDI
jgi:hypothetical protein